MIGGVGLQIIRDWCCTSTSGACRSAELESPGQSSDSTTSCASHRSHDREWRQFRQSSACCVGGYGDAASMRKSRNGNT